MKLLELFEADTKHVTFCFGRLNPPTIGHKQLLDTVASEGGDYKIFVSPSQDPKKNPLDYSLKIKFIKLILPEYAKNIVEDAGLNTPVKVASYLYDQGYRSATFVAGSDRLSEMEKLLKMYNGVEGKSHGYYKFDLLDFKSSGEREDGAEGVAGVSASGARLAAANNDLKAFEKATGAGQYAKPMFDAVRQGMGINESIIDSTVESIDEGIKTKLAGAALVVANLLGNPATQASEIDKPITIAIVVIDGEVRKYNLGNKFSSSKEAAEFISNILDKQGLQGYQLDIRRGYPKKKEEAVEGKFRKVDIEDKVIDNNKLNDLKSKYLPDWEMLDHRILQAKYVAKDHRHALDFVKFINELSEKMDHFAEVTQDVSEVTVKTTTFDVKGLTILDFKLALKIDKFADSNNIEQVRMQGNFGMHESSYGRYWCSTDKKWKTRKGPKQSRKS